MALLHQCLQIDSNSEKECILLKSTKQNIKHFFSFLSVPYFPTMEESHLSVNPHQQFPSSSTSSSSPSTSRVQETAEVNDNNNNQDQNQQRSILSYTINLSLSDFNTSQNFRDDVWSCLFVLVTFWFFASMTLILGFYGTVNLQLGPNCSHLIQTNSFFVQAIQVQELDEAKPGPMLYGFNKPPPLDVEIVWTETHNTFIPANFHKEWIYFLNKGSKIDISFNVKSLGSPPLLLIIATGRESLVEWIQDPSYPNLTLSWNIIHGSGKIQQEIVKPSNYYIAVGNMNSEEAEVELIFTIQSFLYNTSMAYYKCSIFNHLCTLKLSLLGTQTAVLTSPSHDEDNVDSWNVKLSLGPRWIIYFIGSGLMTLLMFLAFRFCNIGQNTAHYRRGFQQRANERTPLLLNKDDDATSLGSSYESISHDEEEPLEALNSVIEEENNSNLRRLCVICFDAPRECFFLPCGHCAACFSCGTRIAEEAGTCPICRRKMKKVRKVFTV